MKSKKVIYYSYVLQIICVVSEENELQLLYCGLAVYFVLFSAFCYLHSPITASGARYRRSACIEYQSTIRTSCGSGLLRHGLHFNRTWCTMRLISVERLEAYIHAEGGHFEHLL